MYVAIENSCQWIGGGCSDEDVCVLLNRLLLQIYNISEDMGHIRVEIFR